MDLGIFENPRSCMHVLCERRKWDLLFHSTSHNCEGLHQTRGVSFGRSAQNIIVESTFYIMFKLKHTVYRNMHAKPKSKLVEARKLECDSWKRMPRCGWASNVKWYFASHSFGVFRVGEAATQEVVPMTEWDPSGCNGIAHFCDRLCQWFATM